MVIKKYNEFINENFLNRDTNQIEDFNDERFLDKLKNKLMALTELYGYKVIYPEDIENKYTNLNKEVLFYQANDDYIIGAITIFSANDDNFYYKDEEADFEYKRNANIITVDYATDDPEETDEGELLYDNIRFIPYDKNGNFYEPRFKEALTDNDVEAGGYVPFIQDVEDAERDIENDIEPVNKDIKVRLINNDGELLNKYGHKGTSVYDSDYKEYPAGLDSEGNIYADVENINTDGTILKLIEGDDDHNEVIPDFKMGQNYSNLLK